MNGTITSGNGVNGGVHNNGMNGGTNVMSSIWNTQSISANTPGFEEDSTGKGGYKRFTS